MRLALIAGLFALAACSDGDAGLKEQLTRTRAELREARGEVEKSRAAARPSSSSSPVSLDQAGTMLARQKSEWLRRLRAEGADLGEVSAGPVSLLPSPRVFTAELSAGSPGASGLRPALPVTADATGAWVLPDSAHVLALWRPAKPAGEDVPALAARPTPAALRPPAGGASAPTGLTPAGSVELSWEGDPSPAPRGPEGAAPRAATAAPRPVALPAPSRPNASPRPAAGGASPSPTPGSV